MRFRARWSVLAGIAAVSVGVLPGPALAAAASAPKWQDQSPFGSQPPGPTTLNAASAVNADDVWAVGSALYGGVQPPMLIPVVLVRDGGTWAPTESGGLPDIDLGGVVATAAMTYVSGQAVLGSLTSPGNIFELGYGMNGVWQRLPLPSGVPAPEVTAGPDGQVWAIGATAGALARWTGKAWQVYRTGLTATAGTSAISALSFDGSKNGWAVGYTGKQPVVLHWNGSAWTKAKAPALPKGAADGRLGSVLVTPSAGVWATGSLAKNSKNWLEHWNGSSWATVTLPPAFVTDHGGAATMSISANAAGAPQWISDETAGDTSSYLYYSGGKWTPAPGATTADSKGFAPRLVNVPGTDETFAIGTTMSTIEGPAITMGEIQYAP